MIGKNNYEALIKSSMLYYNLNEIDKAIDTMNHAVEIRPLDIDLWKNQMAIYWNSISHYINNKEYDKAVSTMDKALLTIDNAKKINEKNLVPFTFDINTVKYLETIKYLKDNLETNSINTSKLTFYYIPQLDVDNDGQNDQFSNVNNYLESRFLTLKQNTRYTIQVVLNEEIEEESIQYKINGITQSKELIMKNGSYIGEFETPETVSEQQNTLIIPLKISKDIKYLAIIEG